jgi:hypothetical protein
MGSSLHVEVAHLAAHHSGVRSKVTRREEAGEDLGHRVLDI